MDYPLIRSRRKTVSIQIKPDGTVIVRAPMRMPLREIEAFVASKASWIAKHAHSKPAESEKFTDAELAALAKQAKIIIPQRVAYYAPLIGVSYGKITIRKQKTLWGSCSAQGNLNFNCLLMLAPSEVLDSVVVHELCHRKHMDHSAAFYREIERVMPDYHQRHSWLKQNGSSLIARLP